MVWPGRLDVIKDGLDLAFFEYRVEAGHAGRKLHAHIVQNRLTAAADVIQQHRIVMVPGMPGFVMRRRRLKASCVSASPIWLPLQIDAMAVRAMREVKGADGNGFWRGVQECRGRQRQMQSHQGKQGEASRPRWPSSEHARTASDRRNGPR